MSDTPLVIVISDSNNEPRCSILWEHGRGKMRIYSAYLAYAIGSLNDDSTTEEIIENICEVFPSVGIPREIEFYTRNNLGIAEYVLSTKYADDLGLSNGNAYDGLLTVSKCSIDKVYSWAKHLNYLYLGDVSMRDGIFDMAELDEGCPLAKAKIEKIKKSTFHVEDEFFSRRITTKEEGNELVRILNKYKWVECEGRYYRVKSGSRYHRMT